MEITQKADDMERISIDTAQNVAIDYEVANIGKRILAAGIDFLIQVAYFLCALFIILPLFDVVSGTLMFNAILTLLFAPAFIYEFACEALMDGQTVGKRLMEIRVVRLNGTRARAGDYCLRWLIGFLEKFGLNLLCLVIALSNGRGQRLGDIAAGTTVVQVRRRLTLSDTILTESIDNYNIHYPQVEFLLESDVALIRTILDRYDEGPRNRALGNIIDKAAGKIKKRMGVVSAEDSVKFLTTVMRDYNHMEF